MKKTDQIQFQTSKISALMLILLLAWLAPLQSQIIKEYTPENFGTFVDDLIAAQPNTEFVFTQGGVEYKIDGFPNIDVPVVMRAADGLTEKPIIVNVRNQNFTHMLRIRSGGTLTVKGLEFNGEYPFTAGVAWAIRTDTPVTGKYHLVVEDCVFRNFYQHAFRAAGNTAADSIIFRNSIFENIDRDAIFFWEEASKTKPLVDKLEVTNCTFSNIDRSVVGFPETQGTINGNVMIENITAYNVGNSAAGYPVLNLLKFAEVSFKNSIISNASDSTLLVLEDNAVVAYNNFYNTVDTTLAGLENTFFINPGFEDPNNGDFTVNNAMLYDKSESAGLPGDPRWAKDAVPNTYYYGANEAAALQVHLTQASDDDIFILTDGGERYVLDGFPNVNAKVTIMAEKGLSQRPILNNKRLQNNTPALRIHEGGSLILKDLVFEGVYQDTIQTTYGIRVHGGITNNYHLVAENCHFHGFKENAVRIDTKTHADSIVFNNCVFENISTREGFRFAAFPATDPIPTFDLLKVTNSTFANMPREAIKVPTTATPTSGKVIIDQVTINNVGFSDYSILRLLAVDSISITNSVFTNSVAATAFQFSEKVYFDYSNLYNLTDATVYGGANMLAVDPMYQDAATHNFMVLNSVLYTAGDQGQIIGDPRWEPFMASATPQTATNDAGQSVLAQSNMAPGYLYMILAGETQETLADFDVAVENMKGAKAEVTEANVDVSISVEGLMVGEYNLYAIDKDGNISASVDSVFTIKEVPVEASAEVQSVTNAPGQVVVAQSNKPEGQLYIVLQGEPQATIEELNAAVTAGKGSKAAVTAADTNIELSADGIQVGVYNLYAIDGQDNISEAVEGLITITVVPVVVFATAQDVTNDQDQTVFVQSSYAVGKVYVLKLGEPYSTVAELDAAVVAKKAATADVTAANTDVAISVTGLVGGIYYPFAVDGDGNISEPGENAINIQDVTNVNEITDQVARIYASQRKLYVDWNIAENAQLEVYNILGSRMISAPLVNGQNIISLNDYKGLLIVKITAQKRIYSGKVLVK